MHAWWCEPEEKDNEPLCEVWDLYHGDTSQYHKIPKDRVPSPETIRAMHDEYCAVPNHAKVGVCTEWLKNKQRAEKGIDDESIEVFDWWCRDKSESNLCTKWVEYKTNPRGVTHLRVRRRPKKQ